MTYVQPSMFPEHAPDRLVEDRPERDPSVERTSGWSLISTRRGLKGWHRIQTIGAFHEAVAHCGVVGHVVPEEDQGIVKYRIIECKECGRYPGPG